MTFLEKYELLKASIPVPATVNFQSIDCEYGDIIYNSKNCYYCIDTGYLEDSLYTILGFWCKNVVDCTYVSDSEKCYMCIDSNKCYNSTFLMDCNNCTDCHFSAFLNSCSDCFGCVGLTHKKYCIFNKQYTKEEYLKKTEELKKNPEKIMAQMQELKKQIPHPASQQNNCYNCPFGDYIYDSRNSYWCFNSYSTENSGYCYISINVKNSWDLDFSGSGDKSLVAEKCYQLIASGRSCYNCAYLLHSNFSTNCFYGAYLKNCSDCFGCVGLTNKKYCILNNQLTKDKYEKAVIEIKRELGWRVS